MSQVNYTDTHNQLARVLTKVPFTRDKWNRLTLCTLMDEAVFT